MTADSRRSKRGFTYTVTEEQVRHYMAVPAEAKLNWLADTNDFLSKALTGRRREIWQKFRRGEI
ncbi:MAG: hypothetical protein Q8L35_06035 [Actinomycetota bacterium]|nr:hypothetical protein [Actinomycetota bacterium]